MNDDPKVRFLFEDGTSMEGPPVFIFRPPPDSNAPLAIQDSFAVKFAQRICILDPWGFELKFRSFWGRILFRLRHPIAYSKRSLWFLWRRIKRIFIKEKRYLLAEEKAK